MSSDLDLNSINFQSQLRSKPVKENFTDIQNNFNALRAEVSASIASTASEVTAARDNFSNLSDNMHIRRVYNDGIATGGIVTAQGTPDNTVRVSAGSGVVNGIGCEWTSATSATIGAVTASRNNVVVINSDNSLGIELGATGTSVLPTISSTQRPLAIITQDTDNPTTIASGDIVDARQQGCWVPKKKKWFFKVQDAIDSLGATLGGDIYVGKGNYYEDLSFKSNQTLNVENGADIYTANGTLSSWGDFDLSSLSNVGIVYNVGINAKLYRYDGTHTFRDTIEYTNPCKLNVTAGDDFIYTHYSTDNLSTGTNKLVETKVNCDGTIRTLFQVSTTPEASGGGQVYKNGSPVGTLRSTSSTTAWTEDFSVTDGDLIQLYGGGGGVTGTARLDCFKIGISSHPSVVETTFVNIS